MKIYAGAVEYPFMIYDFVEDEKKRCHVDFLVYTMHLSNYRISLNETGTILSLKTVLPSFFTEKRG